MTLQKTNSWLLDLKSFALSKNEEIKERLLNQGIKVEDFTLGDPKEPTPLFIQEALIDGIQEISQYPINIGSLELRRSCAYWLRNRFHVEMNPQTEIVSSNGSKEAIFHIPQVLLNAASSRRIIVFPEPGYPVYKSGTILAGGIPYEIPLRSEKNYIFDPLDLPSELLKQIAAVWISYPHNPTGACISMHNLQCIYDWALRHDIMLLSDECYTDIFFAEVAPPPSLLQVAKDHHFKNTICFFTLSKRSGMTGYRSGFVAGDSEKIQLFAKYRLHVGCGTPDFIQKAAIAAWRDEEHVLVRNEIFAKKRLLVDAFFSRNKMNILASRATLYVWGEAPSCYPNGRSFCEELLNQTGIMLTPGDVFGDSCKRNFRMALVPNLEDMKSCFTLWQNVIDKGLFKL